MADSEEHPVQRRSSFVLGDSDSDHDVPESATTRFVAPPVLARLEHLDLTAKVVFDEGRIVASGSYRDICKARCVIDGVDVPVCVKRLRFRIDERRMIKVFQKEIYIWSKLQHPNILPLLGYAFDDETGYPLLVSSWMKNGSAWMYVQRHEDCDLLHLVTGIANGLAYLHEQDVVHSNLNSNNVLVSDTGDAVICDFALSRILAASRSFGSHSPGLHGTLRYTAYEIIESLEAGYSKQSDVWAFGMTLFELLSRQRPYKNYPDVHVIFAIHNKRLPELPENLDAFVSQRVKEGLWEICRLCWEFDPEHRPGITDILQRLFALDDSKADKMSHKSNPISDASSEASIQVEFVPPPILAELKHLDLTGKVVFSKTKVINGGGYGDICRSRCNIGGRKTAVCVKRFRFHLKEDDIIKYFAREIYIWSKLRHPNVLPLLGYVFEDETGYPLLLSSWMKNGSAWAYVQNCVNYDLIRLVSGIAEGLAYVHENGVIHANLKSDNVLVKGTGEAVICGFGCSRMVTTTRSFAKITSGISGTLYYWAYELVALNAEHSTKSDIWAFGMTVYELLERRRAYGEASDPQILGAIFRHELPTLSVNSAGIVSPAVREGLWKICQLCWELEPTGRPTLSDILRGLHSLESGGTHSEGRDSDSDSDVPSKDLIPTELATPSVLAELKHLDLTGKVSFRERRIVNGGGYGDVCKAYYSVDGSRREKVCIKRLRFHLKKDIIMLFAREFYVWSKLKHPNVLPLLGYAIDDKTGYPLLVSKWMKNGSVLSYVQKQSKYDLMRLITGIAEGLEYLHDHDVIHMDMKSDNVLVSDRGEAVICDFGCSRMISASKSFAKVTSGINGTVHYWAYELVALNAEHSKESDIWAFGMTVYELLARRRPYGNASEPQILGAILRLELPTLPANSSDAVDPVTEETRKGLWKICQLCWEPDPSLRSSITDILQYLRSPEAFRELARDRPEPPEPFLKAMNRNVKKVWERLVTHKR